MTELTHSRAPADTDRAAKPIDRRVAEAQAAWREEAQALGKLGAAFGPLARPETYADLAKLPAIIEKVEGKIRSLPVGDRGAALLEEIRAELSERRRRMHESLAGELRKACAERGLQLRVVRREEPVEVRIPPFAVRIDRSRGRAGLLFARRPLSSCEASAEAIVAAHAETLEAMRRGFDAKRFFDACLAAWRAACAARGPGAGERVEILDFLPQLALQMQARAFRAEPNERNYRGYSRARFAFDVLRLRNEEGLSRGGWRMNLGVATGTSATEKDRALFFEDEHGEGEFKLSVFFTRTEGRR